MPHYPDEIEYSDKYMDDYYEYRHVILPRDVYKKMPRGRLLLENVHLGIFSNGEHWEYNNQEVGTITSYIDLNRTFCCLEEQRALTLKLDCHQLTLHLLIDWNYICFHI